MIRTANYNPIAPYYDFLAHLFFGNQLVAAQNHFLSDLVEPEKILVFGGGTGHIIEPLLQLYPDTWIHYLESSSAMISKAKTRTTVENKNVCFTCSTEQELVDKINVYDVVITPFVLDVFEEKHFKKVFKLLYDALSPGGRWVQTDFYVDHNSPGWQKTMIWFMYLIFKIAARQKSKRLPEFDAYFDRPSLRLLAQKSFYHQMIRTHIYEKHQDMEPSH